MKKNKNKEAELDSSLTNDEVEVASSEVETECVSEIDIDETSAIEQLEVKIKQLEDALLRDKAEVENFKRRLTQENANNLKYAQQSLLESLLPVLDGFDRALAGSEQMNEEQQQFLKGFEMIDTTLMNALEAAGLSVIASVGTEFDPYLHQAVVQETDDAQEDNIILEELQKGYLFKERVLRASMVKVNKL